MKLILAICFIIYFVSEAHGASRIIGGRNATDGAYPYMVSLQWQGLALCGGSIINNRWILTAAHCVKGKQNDSINVIAGTVLLKGGDEQIYTSEYLVAHENFNTPRFTHDVGLIRVDRDIEFNDKVQPIKLPSTDVYKVGLPAVITGWGVTKLWGSASPNNLQEIFVKIYDQKKCKKEMSEFADISQAHICSITKSGQGNCHGDSGSPLVANGVQVGIASFVYPCAVGYPDVYVRVFMYLSWIRKIQLQY